MNRAPHKLLLPSFLAIVTSMLLTCHAQQAAPIPTTTMPLPIKPPVKAPSQQAIPKPLPLPSAPIKKPAVKSPIPNPPVTKPTTPAPQVKTIEPQEEEPRDIYLNFENAQLSSFVDYMAEIKKLNIIPDKALEGAKVSLTIREPLSADDAWEVFLTVLETAGFSIVRVGDVHKIIPKDKKLTEPLPSYFNVPIEKLPDSDITLRYVVFLTNIQVGEIQQLLESMLSSPNSIVAQPDMNAFIITDKSNNIKSAIKLIQDLDNMGLPEEVTVMKLKEVNATDAKELLEALIKKPDQNPLARLLGRQEESQTEYFSSSTRIIAEPRTNSLILLGNRKSIQKIIDFISEHIDTAIKEAESPLHIYELQHIDAAQVRDILKEVTTTQLDSATGQAAAKYGSIRGGVKYFRQMNFQVDKDGNRLLFSSVDKQDARMIKDILKDIDKPQPHVAIQTLFVSINANDMKEIGGMTRNKKHGQIGRNIDFQSAQLSASDALELDDNNNPVSLLGNLLNQLITNVGRTALTFGPSNNVWSIFRMIKQETSATILSQPFITIANKKEATISVGETRTIIGEEAGGEQAFKQVKASTDLIVTPQINLDGIIRLNIKLNINEFTDNTGNSEAIRELITDVSVANGQVLALGGFVQTKVTESQGKTPILGDIPVLGWFFKNKSRVIDKQYIFIFMAPTILKPRQSPGMNLYTKLKLHQATTDIEETVETKRTLDPIHNWFFNPEKENYSHKVIDFANARYQPINVDIKNDPYYRSSVNRDLEETIVHGYLDSALDKEKKESEEKVMEREEKGIPDGKPLSSNGDEEEKSEEHQPVVAVESSYAPTIKKEPMPPKQPEAALKASIATKQPSPVPSPVYESNIQTADDATPSIPDTIDHDLARRRKKLKELLLAQPMPTTRQQTPVEEDDEDDKRTSFKNMITHMPEPLDEASPPITPGRRNRLKEFLSANPALAGKQSNSAARSIEA